MQHSAALTPLLNCFERVAAACDALETIADALPDRVAAGQCQRAADETISAMRQMHDCEDRYLMPLLSNSQRRELRQIADDLAQGRKVDMEAALEVEEVLAAFAVGRPILSTDATGYMLRALFEGLRRHISRERDLLALIDGVPPAGQSLH